MSKKGRFFKKKAALKRTYKQEIGVFKIGVAKVYKRILGIIKPLFSKIKLQHHVKS